MLTKKAQGGIHESRCEGEIDQTSQIDRGRHLDGGRWAWDQEESNMGWMERAMGGIEPEWAVSSNEERLSVKGLGHKSIHKNLHLLFTLPMRYSGIYVTQKILEWPTNDLSSLRPIT